MNKYLVYLRKSRADGEHQNENKLTLESINPIYPPMIFTGTKLEEVKIMGVVKKIIKSV